MNDEIVITEENFHEYFRDINQKPERGDIIARFVAIAELVDSPEKRNLIDLLCLKDKSLAAVSVMKNLFNACEKDAYKVPKEIIEDYLQGMTIHEIMQKPYKFKFEKFFYTKTEYVPKDDPHWQFISIMHPDDLKINWKIEETDGEENAK